MKKRERRAKDEHSRICRWPSCSPFCNAAQPCDRAALNRACRDLATVRRIYVEQLGGGQTSDQMRDMIIAALQNSKLFVITENQDARRRHAARIVRRQDLHRRPQHERFDRRSRELAVSSSVVDEL